MPKKKSGSFNATQIKDGKIVRMNKNGTVKSILADYEVKHKEVKKNG
jgi:major membrane immunogen (membrane-anchored lipoprotein)